MDSIALACLQVPCRLEALSAKVFHDIPPVPR